MSQHPFLSDEWIAAARAVHEAHRPALPTPDGAPVRMNLVVEGVPFGPGALEAHLDTSSGVVEIDLGHLDTADVRVTLSYDTAQAILVDGDRRAAMEAFMSGGIRVEGDFAALLTALSGPPGDHEPLAGDLRAITAPADEA